MPVPETTLTLLLLLWSETLDMIFYNSQ